MRGRISDASVDLRAGAFIILIVGDSRCGRQRTRSPGHFLVTSGRSSRRIIELLFECFVPFAGDRGVFISLIYTFAVDIAHGV